MPIIEPKHPLPAPLFGWEPGSFAHYTVTTRLPDLARRVVAENALPPSAVVALETLIQELPDGAIRSLDSGDAPDASDWSAYVQPFLGQRWLQVPWFFAETYFYRRILEATGYFHAGKRAGHDPYVHQKRQGLATTQAETRALADQLDQILHQPGDTPLSQMLAIALWGNTADLSLWPAADTPPDPSRRAPPAPRDRAAQQMLIDDSPAVARYLARLDSRLARVDVVLDNAGFELISDLGLADFLLSRKAVARVGFHLKAHPTFVSDATAQDVAETLAYLAGDNHSATRALAERARDHLSAGRLQLHTDPFWTSPLSMWEMPPQLYAQLAQSSLLISKGDANYRRLLGDRHWPFTTPFADVVGYAPAPLLALRTLKSEVVVGLQPGQPASLSRDDPRWLLDGRWGLIQFTG